MLNPQYNSCDLQVPSYRQISEPVLSTGKQHTLPVLAKVTMEKCK